MAARVICMISAKIDKLVFTELLPEMFRRVGLPSPDINNLRKTPNWFTTQSWTEADEKEFKDWVVVKLRTKMRMTKKSAEREAAMFLLNFGWSCKDGGGKQLELPYDK